MQQVKMELKFFKIFGEKVNKLHAGTQTIVIPWYMNKTQQWLSCRDKGFVWLLEKARFGAMLKFKIES